MHCSGDTRNFYDNSTKASKVAKVMLMLNACESISLNSLDIFKDRCEMLKLCGQSLFAGTHAAVSIGRLIGIKAKHLKTEDNMFDQSHKWLYQQG